MGPTQGAMRILPVLSLALAMFAGCIALPGAEPIGDDAAPEDRVSYLHSAMTLIDEAETNVSVVRTGGFYESWATGDDYPTWVADTLGRDMLVTKAIVTLYLQVTGPAVGGNFPDIMVYGGSGDAWMGFGSRTDYTAFVPGQVYEIEIELGLPPGGMWIAPDQGFGLKVVPVMYQQDDNADVEILLGGQDTASRVAWTTKVIDVPFTRVERGEATGEVTGTIYAGPAAPATTSHRTPLTLTEDARFLIAWMNTTTNVGIPDIDLSVSYPNGTTITTAGTPTPREGIRIAGPNIVPRGEYGLVATTAGSPRAEFTIEWLIGRD